MDANKVIPSEQFGFRREHNTIQPLMRIRKTIKTNFEQQKSTGMILLDIKAAFDTVWHDGLIYKMIKLNFPSDLIKIIDSFLRNRTFKVFINRLFLNGFPNRSWLPTGIMFVPIIVQHIHV